MKVDDCADIAKVSQLCYFNCQLK